MIKLYDSKLSGNAGKIRLLLEYLGRGYERDTLNLAEGRHKTDDFARLNRFRRVPVVELDGGATLGESGAILLHFAEGTDLLPADPILRAEALAWLFFDQADLSRFLAYPRFYAMTGHTEAQKPTIEHYIALGTAALARVEEALTGQDWLLSSGLSVADFALYPYIRMAPEGGYDLGGYPAINAWLTRFEALPRYVPLVEDVAA